MFGGKRGRLASRRTPSHPLSTGVASYHVVWMHCCRRDCCTSQNRWHHEEENYVDILKKCLKTSVRKLKLGRKWAFQMDNDPKHTSKVVVKWLKDTKVNVFEWPSQSPDLILFLGRTEHACACKEAYKPDSVTPALSGGVGQN